MHLLLQKAERVIQAIVRISKRMSQVISQEEISLLTDEWTLYQTQVIPESWYREAGSDEYLRIDRYYNPVQIGESFPWQC